MPDDRRLYEQTGCSLQPHANTKILALDALKMPQCYWTQFKWNIYRQAYPRNGGRQRALIFLDLFNEAILGLSKQYTPLLKDAGGFMKLHDLGQGANPPSPPRFSDDLSRLKAASDKTTLFLICLFWKNNKGAWIKNFFSANFFISNLLKIISVHRHNVQNVEFATSFRCILKR